jgi:hypothetical protein
MLSRSTALSQRCGGRCMWIARAALIHIDGEMRQRRRLFLESEEWSLSSLMGQSLAST